MADPIQVPIPVGRFAPVAQSQQAPVAGGPMAEKPLARYGRLTNPDLLVGVGRPVSVQSTFLKTIQFVPYAEDADSPERSAEQQIGDLYIEFVNGFIGKFPNRTYQDYRAYLSAPSKGKFHRRTPWYSQYETIKPQQYFGAALKARIAANG